MNKAATHHLTLTEVTMHRPSPDQPFADADWRHLTLERIRLRGYRRVLWQRHLWEQTAQVPAQGLAIPHEEIDIVCQGLDNQAAESAFGQSHPQAALLGERIVQVEKRWQEMEHGALERLRQIFSLSVGESDFLLLCLAPELDPAMRRLYGYLHDDASRCAPTPWLARILFQHDTAWRPAADSALVRWLLAYPRSGEEQPWSIMARWQIDPRIVGYLLDNAELTPPLSHHGRWFVPRAHLAYEPVAVPALRRLLHTRATASRHECWTQLVGCSGVGRKTWTTRVCGEQDLPLLVLHAPGLLNAEGSQPPAAHPQARERLFRAEREALLQGCALYWEQADQVAATTWQLAPRTASCQFFGVERPIHPAAAMPSTEVLSFPLPTPAQALTHWQSLLARHEMQSTAAVLAERFTLTPAEIEALAPRAGEGHQALWTACRSLSHGRLGSLATLLPCPYTWDDIVLPADTTNHLREIVAQTDHRRTVYEQWGFGAKRPLGRGVSALFAGPSGTGKTMAAQVLAAELGVVLLRIDLASVVSKYVGETEKNLRQIFDEAERLNAVLFFDEADALFGKRTEVKDAHDRYANIEVNYLLQRMEGHEGLAILASNRKGDLDPAFLRRLRFIVDFPLPGAGERAAIWHLALPESAPDGTPLLEAINWDMLTTRLEISGADIKNIALNAAFLACTEGSSITMKHLQAAARREMAKHGRLLDGNMWGHPESHIHYTDNVE